MFPKRQHDTTGGRSQESAGSFHSALGPPKLSSSEPPDDPEARGVRPRSPSGGGRDAGTYVEAGAVGALRAAHRGAVGALTRQGRGWGRPVRCWKGEFVLRQSRRFIPKE